MRLAVPVALAAVVTAGVLTATASTGSAAAGTTRTHRVVVRPVTAQGRPVSGWSVHRERDVTVRCGGASPAAVSRNVVECSPSAAYLPACWRSAHHTVLCLRDARIHRLVRLSYAGTIADTAAPDHPSPLDLVLAQGQACSIRVGGAWSVLPTHPRWLGFYSCTHGSVYGPPSGDGIDRSHQPWTVHLWRSGTAHDVVRRQVRTAFFVGTHH